MNEKEFLAYKIPILIKEGYDKKRASAIAYSMFKRGEHKQQGGTTQQPQQKLAPQRPIKFIQPVSTEGWRDNGHLPPGDYQKVYYVDPRQAKVENQDYEYLNSSGYDELQRMNNYRIYMEQLRNKNNTPTINKGQAIASEDMQQGGINFNPNYSLTQEPYQYKSIFSDLNATHQLPQYNFNGFQYDPNAVNTAPISAPQIVPDRNPLAADVGSGVNTYTPPQTNANYNPYAGVTLEQSFRMFGQGLGENDPSKIALGGGLSALKLARVGLGGYASGKENKRVQDEYYNNLFKDNRLSTNLQQGGNYINPPMTILPPFQKAIDDQFAKNASSVGASNLNQLSEQIKNEQFGNNMVLVGQSNLPKNQFANNMVNTGKSNIDIFNRFTPIQPVNYLQPMGLEQNRNYQQGGEISNAEVMTGKYTVENPNGGNVTIERGEFVKDNQTGNITEAVGNDHKNGGIKTNLEDAKVLSNFTKIGAKNAKELKERYNLSLKKDDTFADAMKKLNKQLGVNELIEEQAKAIEDLGKNETVKDETTKRLNEGVLKKEVEEYQNKLEELKGAQNFAFEDIFARQESKPKKGNGELINPDGSPMKVNDQEETAQQGGYILELATKHGISPERAMELYQQGGEVQTQQEEQGEISPEQIIQAFAQATQQDPQEIVNQLQQMSPEEQQQVLMQMMQQLQGGESQMQQGGEINPYLQNSTLITDFANAPKTINTLPYTPIDVNPNEIWKGENYNKVWKPLVDQSLANPEQAKKIDEWLKSNKSTFSPNIQKQLEGLSGEKRIEKIKQLATDTKPGLFHNAVLDAIKATSPQTQTEARPEYNQGQVVTNEQAVAPDNTQAFMPYITPPSSRQGVILETAQAPQYERVKRSYEAGQAALENQLATREAQIAASGLAPQIQQALIANESANIANAQNENIARVEQFNAQNQQDVANRQADANFKANLFNIGQRDVYFNRNTAAIDNYELAQKQYNDTFNRLGMQYQQDMFNKSLVNSTASNYRINSDGSITFLPPTTSFVPADNTAYYAWYDKLTPQQQVEETKRRTAESVARYRKS